MSLSADEKKMLISMGEALSGERDMLTLAELDMFDLYYTKLEFRDAYHSDKKIQKALEAINKMGSVFGKRVPEHKADNP